MFKNIYATGAIIAQICAQIAQIYSVKFISSVQLECSILPRLRINQNLLPRRAKKQGYLVATEPLAPFAVTAKQPLAGETTSTALVRQMRRGKHLGDMINVIIYGPGFYSGVVAII